MCFRLYKIYMWKEHKVKVNWETWVSSKGKDKDSPPSCPLDTLKLFVCTNRQIQVQELYDIVSNNNALAEEKEACNKNSSFSGGEPDKHDRSCINTLNDEVHTQLHAVSPQATRFPHLACFLAPVCRDIIAWSDARKRCTLGGKKRQSFAENWVRRRHVRSRHQPPRDSSQRDPTMIVVTVRSQLSSSHDSNKCYLQRMETMESQASWPAHSSTYEIRIYNHHVWMDEWQLFCSAL